MKRLVVAGVVQVLVLLVSCWVTPPALWALDPRKAINAYHLQSWQEGLPHPSVNALVQTPDGYLWLSTFEGLVRFNGVEFTVFNPGNTPALTSNGARPLFVGHDGTLWIGLTGGGLAGCKDGRFFRIPAIDTTIRGRISALYEDRAGRLWIGAQMGLGCFEKGVCRLYTKQDGLPTNDILSLCEDAHGDIWIGLQSVPKVCRFSAGRMEAIPVGKETSSAVLAILPDRANRLWLGTVGDGLYCVENGVQTKIPDPQGIINDVVTTLLEDKDGNIWIGTGGNGLVRMTNGLLTTFTSQEGLPSNLIRSLGEDREGNLWVGTEGGLCRLRDGKLAVISVRAGLPSNDIRGILQDRQGRLWVGSIGGGLSCYQNGTWTHYTTKNGLARNSVRALCEDREGGIWIGFDGGGLCRFINGSLTRFDRAALPNSSSIRSMTLGADGRMWFGTYGGGLTCYQNGSFTHYGQAEGLGSDVVQGLITAHDGTVWMSSQGAGVTCLRNGKFSVYGEKDGLSSLFTWGFYEDAEHTLWIGTNTGLTCYQNGRFFPLRDETSQGIFNTTIGNILEDAHGFLWLVTAKGIAKVEKAQLHQFREGKIRSLKEIPVELFGRAEGAAGDQCNTTAFPAGWKTQEGKLWIPSINGITVVDPEAVFSNLLPPPVVIEKMVVDRHEIDARTSGQLPPESNKFEFHYAGLSFVAPEKVRYRVQLVGYDPDWLEAGALRVAYYTNLPPRAYRFRVLACNNDGVWNLKGAEVSFSIRPPWYQNLWAKGLFVLFGMAAVVSFIRIRLRTLHQKNQILDTKVRERTTELAATVEQLRQSEATIQEKAGELARTIERLQESEQKAHESEHEALKAKGEAEQANQAKSVFFSNLSHELRTPLNAVIGFAQLLGREPGLNTAQRDTLNIIVRSGEHLLNLINDVLSISKIEAGKLTLNHQPFDLRALVHDLQNMLKVRAQAKGLLLLVSIGPEVPAVVSGDEGKLRQVLLNLMGNAIKFTDVGSVTLRVQGGAGNRVEFEVEDTGQGMETDELERSFQPFEQTASGVRSREGTGLGLFISRNFVKLMGGDVQVSSEVGRGTTFSFEIPLPVVSGVIPPPRETRKVIGLQAGQPAFRLLVVDDKEDNRLLLRRLLEGVGFVVREAVDGVEAISVWKEWQPQLIWMDMRMPVMDGYEATKSIRQLEQAQAARKTVTKIIAFTASVLEHERAGIFQAGCNDIVFKPFWEHTIFEKLTEHLQVEFRYEDQAEPAQPTPATPFSLRQMLGGLSADLTGELYQALLIGNVKLATQTVDRIAEHHPEAGRELHQMVRDCQFDEIMDLLETVSK